MQSRIAITQICGLLSSIDPTLEARLTKMLDSAPRIFVAGAGRSGLVARFFAMRLMHGGYVAHVVGEVTTPSIKTADLLLIISGSGETKTMVACAERARELGVRVALFSARSSSTIGDVADVTFQIGGLSGFAPVVGIPMGTAFELSTLLFLESTIAHIIREKGIPEEVMRTRHANLE